jgi:hypothetical protein
MQRNRAGGTAIRAGVALAALGCAACCKRPLSDEEQIHALFDASAKAAEERQVGDAVAPLSDRFRGQGDFADKDSVRRLIAYAVLRGEWTRVAIAGVTVAVEGDRAKATADVVGARSGAGRALADLLPADANAWRVACELEREPKGWRIVRARWREVPFAEALTGSPPLSPASPASPVSPIDNP